ncbi:hypothetical protein D3C76_789190 [compost metagenome]
MSGEVLGASAGVNAQNARVRAGADSLRGSGRFDLQGNPFATWAFVHVAVCFDKLGKREDPGLER